MTTTLPGLDIGPETDTVQESRNSSVERPHVRGPAKVLAPLLAMILFVSAVVGAMLGYATGLETEADRHRGVSLVPLAESGPAERAAQSSDRFAVLREALDFLEEEYIGDIPAEDVLNQAAIDGVLAELGDRYSVLVRPEMDSPGLEETDEWDIGIGARLAWLPDRKRFLVTQTFTGLSAAEAGLRAGDLVVSVDDEPVSWMGRQAATASLRAPAGTEVRIGYRRDGEAFDATVTVREFRVPTVDYEVVGSGSNIGYIRMHSVSDLGSTGMETALVDLMGLGVEAMVLDLRGTAGGSTDAAVQVAGMLTGPGLVAVGEHTDGARTELETVRDALLPQDMPLAVLVDRYSAGASELVAGAIQGHGTGLVIGETTYGNSSGQTDFVLGDGSRLWVSDHLWQTSDGHGIHGQGLIPDVPVAYEEPDGSPEDAEAADPFLQVAEQFLVQSLTATTIGR